MSTRFRLAIAALAVAATACGGSPPPAAEPAPAAAAEPAPAADIAPAPSAEPDAPKAAPEPAPLSKPKSKWTIGGASVSDVDSLALLAAFKKAGWVKDGTMAGTQTGGQYESVGFDIVKGKVSGRVQIVRPAAKPSSATPLTAPSDLPGRANKDTTAFTSDPDADVFLSIEITAGGKAADAKRLLGSIAKKGK